MITDKKAQMLILKIMIAVVILIISMIMISPVKESIDTNTNTSQLNCSSTSLSTSNQATCVVLDFLLFYILGAAISVGMAFIAGKKDISGVITAIVIFVIVTILIEPLKDLIIYARDASHLNCATTTSVAAKMSCILIDLWLFWFIAAILSAATTYIFVKKVLRKE